MRNEAKKNIEEKFPIFDVRSFAFMENIPGREYTTTKILEGLFPSFSFDECQAYLPLPRICPYKLGEDSVTLKGFFIPRKGFGEDVFLEKTNAPNFVERYWLDGRKRGFLEGYGFRAKSKLLLNNFDVLKDEIDEGKNFFGENLYIVTLANWMGQGLETSKFSVVGESKGDVYLVGTTEKEAGYFRNGLIAGDSVF